MSATLRVPTVVSSTSPARPKPTKERDPWFDNAKMLLVTLVLVGHSWMLLPYTPVDAWLFDFLYLWHVPAFVMVTGYLSRSFTWSRASMNRLLTTVALPYLVFEVALAGFRHGVGGEQLDWVVADPHWPMWYLSALLLWRLATPLFTRMRAALPLAVLVSLLSGLVGIEVLDVQRAMGLLPFFVVGLLARREHLQLLRRPAVRLGAAAAMLAALVLATQIEGHLATEWLYWRSGNAEIGASFLEGTLLRLGLLLLCGAVAVSFLALVPSTGGWFTRLGPATMVVYLFHGFVVKAAEYSAFPGWASAHPGAALVLTSTLAVVLALLLASPPVARRLNVVVDPVGAYHRYHATLR